MSKKLVANSSPKARMERGLGKNDPNAVVSTKAVTRATPAETAARVERIVDMMRSLEWQRGKTAPMLAQEWGLATSTVEALAAEASRVVAREVTDPDGLKAEVATVLRANLHRASAAGEFGDVAKLGDVVTKIVGARAPERHEVAMVVAKYESWPKGEKVKWLREKAGELLSEADRLEADGGDR